MLEHRLAVGDEDTLDREAEERTEVFAHSRVAASPRRPRLGAEPQATALRTENDIARDERTVLGNPVDDLAPAGEERLDAAGERVTRLEDVGDLARPTSNGGLRPHVSPEPGAVALDHLAGTPGVPVDRDEHVNRAAATLNVAVEHRPEGLRFPGWDERVDQAEGVGRLVEDAADVLPPLLVPGRPTPEPGRDLAHVHD